MPIEAAVLRDAPIEADSCPNCGMEPLELMMRGMVHRRKWEIQLYTEDRWWWPFVVVYRPYCAVICSNCKETIAWEEPTPEMYDAYYREQVHRTAGDSVAHIFVDEDGNERWGRETQNSSVNDPSAYASSAVISITSLTSKPRRK